MGPAALGIAAIAMVAAGAATGAYAQYKAGQVQNEMAKRNAAMARQAAADAKERGAREEEKVRRRTSALIGRQRAIIGGSGLSLESGSALNVLADTEMLGELDAQTVQNNAAREAFGYEVQAQNFVFEGELAEFAGNWGAVSTLFQGAGQALSMRASGIGGKKGG